MIELNAAPASAVAALTRLPKLPCAAGDTDYTDAAAAARRDAVVAATGTELSHVARFSFDPALTRHNTEGFAGAAQVPLGFAGPLLVDGEYAQGEFYVPLATSGGNARGELQPRDAAAAARPAASARRSSTSDAARAAVRVRMRAPRVRSAVGRSAPRGARVRGGVDDERRPPQEIEQYQVGKLRWLRLDFTPVTPRARTWSPVQRGRPANGYVAQEPDGLLDYQLGGSSRPTRSLGDQRPALARQARRRRDHAAKGTLARGDAHDAGRALRGSSDTRISVRCSSGAGTNGIQVANAVAAIFIACGQDVANVAESGIGSSTASHADGDYYYSLTLPSLIVATYGGGTGLPTQRECLQALGCVGRRQGAEARGDRRGDRALRRDLIGIRGRRGRVGLKP